MRRPIHLVLLMSLFCSAPVEALEWWASQNGDYSLEGRGLLKEQAALYHFYDEPLLFPEPFAGESLSGMRMGLTWLAQDLEFSLDFETRLIQRTSGLSQSTSPDFGAVGLNGQQDSRPRLVDIPQWDSTGVAWQNDVDRLYVKLPLGPVDVTLGRQAVSWGSAWFWKVTDRFSPFSPMEIDPEFKRGVDGIRTEWYLGATTSLDVVATFEREPWRWNLGSRFRTTLGRYDLALSAARLGTDWMGGAELSGELWDFGVRGEAAVTWNQETDRTDVQAVLGLDYGFGWNMKVATELFYNGYGTADSSDYVTYFLPDAQGNLPPRAERLLRGETFNVGRALWGLSVDQQLHPLVHLVLSGMVNLLDPSALSTLSLQWSVQQNVRLLVGGMLPLGARPNFSQLRLPSEFGMLPQIGFVVLKVAF